MNKLKSLDFHLSHFSGQLWKLTSNKKLQNQNGDWLYSSKRWIMPGEGKKGSIKDKDSGKVLSILSTMNVDLEDKKDLLGKIQGCWRRSKEDADGWFRLSPITGPSFGKFLCAKGKSRIILAGKNYHFLI